MVSQFMHATQASIRL